jgi:copper(I)-binding protein
MTLVKILASALAMIAISATVTSADGITINDAYARSAGKTAKAGAAFFMIANDSDQEDRLIDVMSSAAKKVELHTHVDQGDGVMKMVHVKEGFSIPAGGQHLLKRGGDHVMFMGLNSVWSTGDVIPVTLFFERAGQVTIDVIVDLERHDTMQY